VKADDPGDVMATIGTIEDAMHTIESAYYRAVGNVARLDMLFTYMRAQLWANAEGKSADDRKQWVERGIMGSDEWQEYVDAKTEKAEKDTHFTVLAKRLSACQSVLKRHEQSQRGPGMGRGQQNV
jgi:hypothetical protein